MTKFNIHNKNSLSSSDIDLYTTTCITNQNILDKHQIGFRKEHSIHHAIIALVVEITKRFIMVAQR